MRIDQLQIIKPDVILLYWKGRTSPMTFVLGKTASIDKKHLPFDRYPDVGAWFWYQYHYRFVEIFRFGQTSPDRLLPLGRDPKSHNSGGKYNLQQYKSQYDRYASVAVRLERALGYDAPVSELRVTHDSRGLPVHPPYRLVIPAVKVMVEYVFRMGSVLGEDCTVSRRLIKSLPDSMEQKLMKALRKGKWNFWANLATVNIHVRSPVKLLSFAELEAYGQLHVEKVLEFMNNHSSAYTVPFRTETTNYSALEHVAGEYYLLKLQFRHPRYYHLHCYELQYALLEWPHEWEIVQDDKILPQLENPELLRLRLQYLTKGGVEVCELVSPTDDYKDKCKQVTEQAAVIESGLGRKGELADRSVARKLLKTIVLTYVRKRAEQIFHHYAVDFLFKKDLSKHANAVKLLLTSLHEQLLDENTTEESLLSQIRRIRLEGALGSTDIDKSVLGELDQTVRKQNKYKEKFNDIKTKLLVQIHALCGEEEVKTVSDIDTVPAMLNYLRVNEGCTQGYWKATPFENALRELQPRFEELSSERQKLLDQAQKIIKVHGEAHGGVLTPEPINAEVSVDKVVQDTQENNRKVEQMIIDINQKISKIT